MSETELDTAADELLYEVRDGIGHVTLNRPQARNALTFAMYEGLAEICRTTPTDGSVKAIIITGAGDKAFAAGTDIAQFRAFKTPQDALDYEQRIDKVMGDIERCPVPTIAAMHGACTGGGAGIAAACDLRLCSGDLKFGFPIARTLGNCLSTSNLMRLVSLVGAGRTRELLFTARLVGAQEASALGLVAEVLDSQEALLARARELAEQMATFAPLTLRATKEALRRLKEAQQLLLKDHDLIEMCYMSEDFREGMEAFLAKRKPDWKGR
ncbi:enoyl-CoA hydratase/isomerase family protein [Breoghania sp. L-A4]|uniref:enoyl-CoA hydratase/isomerase family protein n=1 Tax=Breoghania sp. L-A4 TaxID=2304600 RepID=UPI000E35E35E|nr:enoyl-CoA hydratase/isomerase family protein [Breoghania sp. L-A4]AXS41409.1 enoyl-CoA hydratase [Breoghania sp. L-A4]